MKEMGWVGRVALKVLVCKLWVKRHSEDLHINGRIFKWI